MDKENNLLDWDIEVPGQINKKKSDEIFPSRIESQKSKMNTASECIEIDEEDIFSGDKSFRKKEIINHFMHTLRPVIEEEIRRVCEKEFRTISEEMIPELANRLIKKEISKSLK